MLAVVALGLTMLVGTAPTALAHAQFLSSDPAEGASLDQLPAEVAFVYSEALSTDFVDAAVVPPGGEVVTADTRVEGSTLHVDMASAGSPAAGTWQVVARVVSEDGHPVEQTSTFVLTGADPAAGPASGAGPAAAAAAAPADATDPSAPQTEAPAEDSADPMAGQDLGVLGVVLVVAIGLAGAAAVVVHLRRGR